MDRKDFYYRQLVTEGDLDEMFDLVEAADRDFVIDSGLIGVYFGLDVAEAGVPNLTVQVAAGSAYDQTGQRIAIPSTQVVPLSVDSNNVTTAVTTPGNTKIVSLFVKFKRALSNPKTDGNNATVQYNRDESYEFYVTQGAEGLAPTPPSLESNAILLADITRAQGVTTITNSDISTDRRQWAINVSAGSYEIKAGQAETAFQSFLTTFNAYVTGLSGNTGAAQVGYAGGSTWADGTTNPATTVEAQLDKVITDLGSGAGTAKVRGALLDAGGVYQIAAGTLASQLLALLTAQKDHQDDTSDAHDASAISFSPAGNLAATDVQAALQELDGEKGGLATANTWTAANTFRPGVSVQPTSGNAYIKMRSNVAADATDETMVTQYFRFDSSFALGGAQNFTVLPAAQVPDNCLIMISAHVMGAFGGNADVATWQSYEVAMYKLSGTTTLKNGGLETQAVKDFAGSGGDLFTSGAWAGNADGSIRFTCTAGGVGTAFIAVAGRISFIRVSA